MVVPCCSNLFQFVPMSHVGWCNFKRCTAPPVPGWSKLAFPCFQASLHVRRFKLQFPNQIEKLRWSACFLLFDTECLSLFPIQSRVVSFVIGAISYLPAAAVTSALNCFVHFFDAAACAASSIFESWRCANELGIHRPCIMIPICIWYVKYCKIIQKYIHQKYVPARMDI